MFTDIFDSVPGIGHAKGAFHYLTGNVEAARRSMFEASRTTAVIAGGAVGALGGPACMVAGAVGAGAAVDTVTSFLTNTPQGYISGISDIVTEISYGNMPIVSVVRTGLIVGSDVIGGLGGPGIAVTNVGKSTGKSIAKEIVKDIVKKEVTKGCWSTWLHGYTRIMVESNEKSSKMFNSVWCPSPSRYSSKSNEQSRSNKSDRSRKTKPSSTGSSGDPPNNNQNNNKKEENDKETHWGEFLRIFNKETLEEIVVKGKQIFNGINPWQRKELKDFIVKVRKNDYISLKDIVNLTLKLLSQLNDDQITFYNFLNVAKFVDAYLHDHLTQANNTYNECPSKFTELSENFATRRREIAALVINNATNSDDMTILFKSLLDDITGLIKTTSPNFSNIITAVYHYFKHRYVANKSFSTVEYFNYARKALAELKTLPQLKILLQKNVTRIVYERYYANVGRRLMIVLKLQDMKKRLADKSRLIEWNLSSCYFQDDDIEGDKDGDEWLNGEKVTRPPLGFFEWIERFFF